MIAYLAHPIDYSSEIHDTAIANTKRELENRGYWVYHPQKAWSVAPSVQPDGDVQRANVEVLFQADLLVAVLWSGFTTIGTIVELVVAAANDIPAVIVGDIKRSVSTEMLGVPVYHSVSAYLDDCDWSAK